MLRSRLSSRREKGSKIFCRGVRRYPGAVVVDPYLTAVALIEEGDFDARVCVANGVAQQVDHCARHEARLDADLFDLAGADLAGDSGGFGFQGDVGDDAIQPARGVDDFPVAPDVAVLQAGVGQQFGDHFLQFAEIGAHVLYQVVAYFGVDLLVQLLEFEGQAGDRRAQFVGYRVGQFTLVADQAFDAVGHLVEVLGQGADVGASENARAR